MLHSLAKYFKNFKNSFYSETYRLYFLTEGWPPKIKIIVTLNMRSSESLLAQEQALNCDMRTLQFMQTSHTSQKDMAFCDLFSAAIPAALHSSL